MYTGVAAGYALYVVAVLLGIIFTTDWRQQAADARAESEVDAPSPNVVDAPRGGGGRPTRSSASRWVEDDSQYSARRPRLFGGSTQTYWKK